VIKTCYNNGQKERLCLIIDKCRRQKLCKRVQKISAAAPSNFHKIKIHVYFLSEHFEFRHFRPHYLDVDTIFGDLRRECLHQPFTNASVRNSVNERNKSRRLLHYVITLASKRAFRVLLLELIRLR
jgi:hypothetical protein